MEDDEGSDSLKMVNVTLNVDGPTSQQIEPRYNDSDIGQPDMAIQILGDLSVMIVAVPDTVTAFDTYADLTNIYDKQLLNLANNNVTLTLPFGKPIRLIEFIFSGTLSIEQIFSESPVANREGISEPFTIENASDSKKVVVNLISLLTTKEKTYFSQTELNEIKTASVSSLLENGFSDLDKNNVVRAKIFFQDADSKSGNLSGNTADIARYFSAYTRLLAIAYNTKSDGDKTDAIEDLGDIFDALGCSETGRDPTSDESAQASCPESETLPTAFDNGEEAQDILYKVFYSECIKAIRSLDAVTASFSKKWTEPNDKTLMDLDYGDAVALRAAVKSWLAAFLIEHGYKFSFDLNEADREKVTDTDITNRTLCYTTHAGGYLNEGNICEYRLGEKYDADITGDAETECRDAHPGGYISYTQEIDSSITDQTACNNKYGWNSWIDSTLDNACIYSVNKCRYNENYKTLEQMRTTYPDLFALRDSGKHTQLSKVLLKAVVDDLTTAIDNVLAETDDQGDDFFTLTKEEEKTDIDILNDWEACKAAHPDSAYYDGGVSCRYRTERPWTTEEATSTKKEVADFKKYLDEAYEDNNNTPDEPNDDVVFNISSFFAGWDLLSMLPTISGDNLTGTLPDPTFGGLFTKMAGGDPADINVDGNKDGIADILQNDLYNLAGFWYSCLNLPVGFVGLSGTAIETKIVSNISQEYYEFVGDLIRGPSMVRVDGGMTYRIKGNQLLRLAKLASTGDVFSRVGTISDNKQLITFVLKNITAAGSKDGLAYLSRSSSALDTSAVCPQPSE